MRDAFVEFAHALALVPGTVPARLRELPGASNAARFEIHRRNRRHALIEVLVARHPVSARLVGDEFFRALADEFVRRLPPRSPALLAYGTGFGDFLEVFEPARAVDCLPDLARLEEAWQSAFHAAEADAIGLPALASMPAEAILTARLEPHPATHLLVSEHPVATLWALHQDGITAPLDRYTSECALIVRPQADVHILTFAREAASFLQALLDGVPFEAAVDGSPPGVEFIDLLSRLLEAGAFTRIHRTGA